MNARDRTSLAHAALIAALVIAVYGGTLHYPFVFDDAANITQNPAVTSPSPAMFYNISAQSGQRPVMLATFAINYALGGADPAGYHVFNIALHAINSILAYFLISLTLRRTGWAGARMPALFGALLFALHPVQTEAVTYIVSRSVLLCTACYLGGILLYASDKLKRPVRMASLLAVSTLGMASRESFVTFPVALVLYDYLILSGRDMAHIKRSAALYAASALPALYLAYLVLSNDYQGSAGFGSAASPLQYLMTQFQVFGTYLRLLVLPVAQNVDYDYPASAVPLQAAATLGYLSAWGLGVLLFVRRRNGAALAVTGFMLVLLPDSSIVPLSDVIFEHRLYLASVFAFGLFAATAYKASGGKPAILAVILLALCAYGTVTRNEVWRSPLALWADAASKSPSKARPHNNLGIAYKNLGRLDEAISELRITVRLMPRSSMAHSNLGAAYNANSMPDYAIAEQRIALELDPQNTVARYNLGRAYEKSGRLDEAIAAYAEAGDELNVKVALAEAYERAGRYADATLVLMEALKRSPDNAELLQRLGRLRTKLSK